MIFQVSWFLRFPPHSLLPFQLRIGHYLTKDGIVEGFSLVTKLSCEPALWDSSLTRRWFYKLCPHTPIHRPKEREGGSLYPGSLFHSSEYEITPLSLFYSRLKSLPDTSVSSYPTVLIVTEAQVSRRSSLTVEKLHLWLGATFLWGPHCTTIRGPFSCRQRTFFAL